MRSLAVRQKWFGNLLQWGESQFALLRHISPFTHVDSCREVNFRFPVFPEFPQGTAGTALRFPFKPND